jgi:Ca-activated chloride channel family protein
VRVDEESLKAVARITEGEYFYAASAQELVAVYRKLQGKLALETRETELSFALAGLMLLLSLAALLMALRGQRRLQRAVR